MGSGGCRKGKGAGRALHLPGLAGLPGASGKLLRGCHFRCLVCKIQIILLQSGDRS